MFEKDMILQGTTPSLTITINPEDVQLSDIVDVELTFGQGSNVLYKGINDVDINSEENVLSYHFTEEETLGMNTSLSMYWQLRLKTNTGDIFGTRKQAITIEELQSTKRLTS